MKNFLFLILSLLTFSLTVNAQHVNFKVSDVETTDPAMKQQMEGFFKSMKMDIYSTPDMTVSEVNMMNGMTVMKTFAPVSDAKTIIFSEVMGNKLKVVPTDEETKEIKAEAEKAGKDSKFSEVTPAVTKTILGYTCKKYLLKNADMEMEMFVTPDIKMSTKAIQGFQGVKIDGFPLQYIVNAAGNKITFTADKVEKDFDKSKLDEPKGNYKEVNYTEFKKSMSGMAGQ